MVRIDAKFQKSKAIKGSVFEQMMNGTKNDYVIVSSTDFNARNGMALCSKIVPYTESEKSNPYAVPFETVVSNMIQRMCVLTNTQYIFKVMDLKVYKYHMPQELIDQVDHSYMDIIFGKRLYTIEECRQAVAEDDIKLKVKYENKVLSNDSEESIAQEAIPQIPQIENYNMSVEDEQAYYAQMYGNSTMPKKDVTVANDKTESFNTVISDDFKFEDAKSEISYTKKSAAKLDSSNKTRGKISRSKTGASIIVVSGKNKEEKKPILDIPVPKKKKKRSYVDRSNIWDSPDLFLLDVATLSRQDILEKYSINTWPQANVIIGKAKKICKERDIDISRLEEM